MPFEIVTNSLVRKNQEDDIESYKAPLIEHLRELRQRLLYSFTGLILIFLVCLYFSEHIFNFLIAPLQDLWQENEYRRMIFTAMHEKFFTDIKVAFFSAFYISFPILIMQIWLFIAPGLYRNEKKAFILFLLSTPLLFILGAAFVYYLVLPIAWEFFLSFEQQSDYQSLAIILEPKVNEYLNLTMQLVFAFGICFELPVFLTLLLHTGLISTDGLRKKRRHAILAAFITSAILTPPDPISQIGLAIPIILMYEISILFAYVISNKSK